MVARKASLSSSLTCGPSGLLGDDACVTGWASDRAVVSNRGRAAGARLQLLLLLLVRRRRRYCRGGSAKAWVCKRGRGGVL